MFGGYLVPRYSPHSIRDHAATLRFLSLNPRIDQFEIDRRSKQIVIDYGMRLPSARRLILNAYFETLMKPIIAKTGSVHWQKKFARYLSLRIIGVFDIFSMSASDLLFSLIKLIEAHDEGFDFHRFLAA